MIRTLKLENFRCFAKLDLSFSGRSTVVLTGSNGRGKTSILEAVFYLASLRSFRTQKLSEMAKLGSGGFALESEIQQGRISRVCRAESDGSKRMLLIDDVRIGRASDFAGLFAAVAFLPSDPEIITGRPPVRRRFLDMYISTVDREYFSALQIYGSALRNRNALLRSGSRDTALLRAYHPIMAKSGALIDSKRCFHLRILNDFMRGTLEKLRPGMSDIEIRTRGMREASDEQFFMERLDSGIDRDMEKHYTFFGPQGDDYDFISGGRSLRVYGSRGQCAATALALKTAQFDITRGNASLRDSTVALADDVTGDLDVKTKTAFFEKLSTAHQTFMTFTEQAKYAGSTEYEHIDLELYNTHG